MIGIREIPELENLSCVPLSALIVAVLHMNEQWFSLTRIEHGRAVEQALDQRQHREDFLKTQFRKQRLRA